MAGFICLLLLSLNVVVTESLEMKEVRKWNEFDSFKLSMEREIYAMKTREHVLLDKVEQLVLDNMVKEVKLKDMEHKLELMEKKMRADKTGYPVKRQSQIGVAFTAYLDHTVYNISHQQPVVYNQLLLNDGNTYDRTTGKFTAPVSGVYIFSYSVGSKIFPNLVLSQYDIFTRLVINGVHQVSSVAESTATFDDEQGSTTAILFVQEGSMVWIRHELRGANYLYSDDTERVSSFTGALLYESEQPHITVGR